MSTEINSLLDHPGSAPAPSLQASSAPLSQEPAPAETDERAFERLAGLTPAQYDRLRRGEAERLGIRLETLDAEVGRRREERSDHALVLPPIEPWPEPVVGHELLHAIEGRFTRQLVLPPGAGVVLTLWAAHAHAFEAFILSPRLNLSSPTHGCGKTTTLEILACLVPKPLRTESLTAAVLFRLVHQFHPTLLLDEVDAYLHQAEELRGLLNAGHRRGACACRCEGENYGVRAYQAFGPAVLAGIGSVSGTLLDRSIVVPLVAAEPGEIPAQFDPRHTEVEATLARQLARWTRDNFAVIEAADPPLPAGAFNRLADNWRPLLAIAQVAGADWPELAGQAFGCLAAKRSPAGQELTRVLLADIRSLFAQAGASRLFSNSLAEALGALPERPWSAGRGQRPIDGAWLASRLSAAGVNSRNVRIAGRQAKGYELADFGPAFARFLGSSESASQ